MSKSLVQIVSEFNELDRELMESGGEIDIAQEALLIASSKDLQAKVDNYYQYCEHLESKAMYFKGMADQYVAARKLFENRREQLRATIRYAMETMKVSDLEGNDFRFKLSKSKFKTIIDKAQLPAEYRKEVSKVVITSEPDMDLIESDLKLGVAIPGVTIEESRSLLSYVCASGKAKRAKEVGPGKDE